MFRSANKQACRQVRRFSMGVPEYHIDAVQGSVVKDKVVTLFGATSLMGVPTIETLFAAGAAAIVLPYRNGANGEERMKRLVDLQPRTNMGCGDRIVPVAIDFRHKGHLEQVCSKSNVVVNLIGRDWHETKDGGFVDWSMYDIQTNLAGDIAQAARDAGCERHLYTSALAAKPKCLADYSMSKWLGERACDMKFGPDNVNFRTAAFLGDGDREFCYYAMQAAKYGAIWMPLKGSAKKQHLYIYDVAAALVKSLECPGELIQVAGRRTTKHGLAAYSFKLIGKEPNVLDMDENLAAAIASAQDLNTTACCEGTDMHHLRYYVDIALPENEGQGDYDKRFGLITTPWDIAHEFPTIQKLRAAVESSKSGLVESAGELYIPATIGYKPFLTA